MRQVSIAVVLAASLALLGGCAATTTAYAPYPPVPPPRPETIPKPPVTGTQLIWQPGHWNWTGSGYAWVSGLYVPQGAHGNMFMPGHWQQAPSGWTWQPAHWL